MKCATIDKSIHITGDSPHQLATYSELVTSLLSFYGSGAPVLNEHFSKEFLPVGKPFVSLNRYIK